MVLVIEDENVSRKALTILLSASGHAAAAFESAEEAIQFLRRGTLPNVALVDLDLPGMSGAEFVRYLTRTNPTIRTVLITAADEERVATLGCARDVMHLRKPIDFNRLLQFLEQPPSCEIPAHAN